MIERNIGNETRRRLENVDGVEPPAHANFQHRRLNATSLESKHGGQRTEFEISQGRSAAHSFYTFKCGYDLVIGQRFSIHTNALVVAENMRRGVGADGFAERAQQRGRHRN